MMRDGIRQNHYIPLHILVETFVVIGGVGTEFDAIVIKLLEQPA